MIDENTRLRPKSDNIAATIIDGEAIIVNLSTGIYYSMESPGSLVWKMVEQQQSIGRIAGALASQFDTTREQALDDVQRLTAQLLEEDLVESFLESQPDETKVADSPTPESGLLM